MATITKGQTFGALEQITNTKLHNLVDLATISSLVNSEVSDSAAIAESKISFTGVSIVVPIITYEEDIVSYDGEVVYYN